MFSFFLWATVWGGSLPGQFTEAYVMVLEWLYSEHSSLPDSFASSRHPFLNFYMSACSWELALATFRGLPLGTATTLHLICVLHMSWKIPRRFLSPYANPRVACRQWLRGMEVNKPKSCFWRCNWYSTEPVRSGWVWEFSWKCSYLIPSPFLSCFPNSVTGWSWECFLW